VLWLLELTTWPGRAAVNTARAQALCHVSHVSLHPALATDLAAGGWCGCLLQFFARFNRLLASSNYVTRRQSLKVSTTQQLSQPSRSHSRAEMVPTQLHEV
jgi:hypothetical protein